MKRKDIRDIIVGCFLISSLLITTFIVSCSDQDIVSSLNSDKSSPYHQHVHGKEKLFNAAVTGFFQSIGQGSANQLGYDGVGWAFGAMGLTSQSPDYTAQLNEIIKELGDILTAINTTNGELAEIEATLNAYTCDYTTSQIYPDITTITNFYSTYQNYIYTANQNHDTIPNSDMILWVNEVLKTTTGIPTALASIQTNLGGPATTNAITSCIDTTLISPPQSGTFKGDSAYYAGALNVLYYYYYWQTVALGLLSEAYHYNAWIAAGTPGSDSGYSADSVELICSNSNFNVQFNCNAVIQASNNVYNSLLTQFQYVGAPYTDENLLFQKNANGENVVWVRSLEDYTSQSGASCNYPLNINNLCGPTVGKAGSTFSSITYYGTQNFTIPGLNELNGLVDPTPSISSGNTVGYFLDSVGFENMNVNPPKVLIADTLIKLVSTGNDFAYYIDTMSVIPYISPGYPVFTQENYYGDITKRAIYSELYDFIGYNQTNAPDVSMYYTGYTVISNAPCSQYSGTPRGIKTSWFTRGSALPWGGPAGYSGSIYFCQEEDGYDVFDITPFTWNSAATSPGWSYYSVNSAPQNAFFIPIRKNFSGSTGCVSYAGATGGTYSNINKAGVVTKCGTDFQDFISANFPVPPTCIDTIVVCYNY